MTTVQKRRARARGGELDDCLRACAVHSGKVVGSVDRRRVELAEQLRKLLVVWGTTATSAAAPAPAGGATALLKRAVKGAAAPSGGIPNELLDALLAVANKALECGYDDELNLALVISDTVLAQRKNSRAGWRLRARLLETLGEEAEAVEAYDKYLALTDDDGFGVRARIAGLRVAAEKERELLALLRRQNPRAEEFTRRAATDVWAEGLAAQAVGDWTEAEPRLVGALLTLAAEDSPVADRQELLSQYLDLRMTQETDLAALTEALALYAEQRRNRMRGPVADPTIGGVQWISLGEFRNRIAGKSICLIANSGRVGASSMGAEIDAYDIVVRFNSYKIDPKHTGGRTDIHATIHKHGFNWDQRVDTRLVFGGISGDWKYSLRNRLVPGAQTFLGDESLRWPVRNIGKLGTDVWSGIPTTGFNMLYLLDFLDVSPTLDLIGFDFYESGAYRVPEAMKLAITSVHEYTSEKAWVMQRAQSVTDLRISLR
ncbi:glycosyl transferase family 29 (putative sialyltransferase) [Streptomyces sp. TLI_55]|uniref:glycosyltransferase family 29 protein n=1 Tax=Streptomyces sp. TLI_55 TaxID=1938861 RepID=UPI000BCA6CD7|nr:glycosyltransferase family 29 protein [Streptomyces sp. TLI_55]SNX63569.1 glycosyl transferase family 29 (putative sialyltransferase) [Streptomyces sp. TLI_55]